MSFLETLYKDVILEHYKRPHHRHALPQASHTEEGVNPSCGDELTLYLLVEDGVIRDVGFEGEGCAISQASASLMTDAIQGVSVERALELSRSFKAMIHGEPPGPELGELTSLRGIARLHARVKCATLAWTTLDAALASGPGGDGGGRPGSPR